jgi:hypothetical protein
MSYDNELDFNDVTEDDEAWAEDVGKEIRRLESRIGRSLTSREMNALIDDATKGDATGRGFDAFTAFEDHYVERGDTPHDKSTPEGRTQYMAELMREGIAAEKEEAEE